MKKIFINIFGWYGAFAIVTAYILVSFSFLSAHSALFQILNGTGAMGIVTVSLYDKDYQAVVLNIIWTLVALIAIINILR